LSGGGQPWREVPESVISKEIHYEGQYCLIRKLQVIILGGKYFHIGRGLAEHGCYLADSHLVFLLRLNI
jgi:hypothetical protein